jgi:N-acetylglucosamine-6-phosphate deacetylase
MKTFVKNGMVYRNHCFQKADIQIDDGKIQTIGPNLFEEGSTLVDGTGMWVVPGFIDIHTHGADGVDVNAATGEDFEKICRFQARQGTTSWLASVLTDTKEQTLWCIEQYNRWKQGEKKGAHLMGIHLEGPFLSTEYKGAMPEHLLQKPNTDLVREYQKAAGGDIRYLTIAPELEGAISFISQMKELGIVVSIGHSAASYETAMEAIKAGAASSTHTGNAMKLLHQRFPAIWGAALESDTLYCEMICDGLHLHPGVIRLTIKAKGLDKVVAVTDSIMAAGLPDGNYKLGVNDVVVKDGDAKLAGKENRAGSTLTTGKALKNLLSFTGKSLEEILPLLTENPARLLGVYDRIGSIEEGKDADLVLLDQKLEVCETMVKGLCVL